MKANKKYIKKREEAHKKFKEGNRFEGIEIMKEILKEYPQESATYIELARYYRKRPGQIWTALEILLIAEKNCKENALIYGDAGFCFFKAGHPEEALAYQRKALELDKNNAQLKQNVVGLLLELDKTEEAKEFLEKAMREDPLHKELLDAASMIMEKVKKSN